MITPGMGTPRTGKPIPKFMIPKATVKTAELAAIVIIFFNLK